MSSPSDSTAAREAVVSEKSPSKNEETRPPGSPEETGTAVAEPTDDSVTAAPAEEPSATTKEESASAPPLPNETAPDHPPLPSEPVPDGGPPLPSEPVPAATDDDGWDCQWDPNALAWFFYNRFTGKSQWDNPRIPDGNAAPTAPAVLPSGPQPPASETPAVGGYNPAIHGNYDPNAWYAKGYQEEDPNESAAAVSALEPYGSTAQFNRFTGQFQSDELGPNRHSDDAKSRRQMNAYFDVDAAANSHDGRSLKAERSNKKPSKTELKAFKEKRKARKEEKRRAWLRD